LPRPILTTCGKAHCTAFFEEPVVFKKRVDQEARRHGWWVSAGLGYTLGVLLGSNETRRKNQKKIHEAACARCATKDIIVGALKLRN